MRIGTWGLLVALGLVVVACDESPGVVDGGTGGDASTPLDSASGDGAVGDAAAGDDAGRSPPTVILPEMAFGPTELGLLVNLDDPQSVAVAEAYRAARGIPEANVVVLSLATSAQISREDFAPLFEAMNDALPPGVQALAITWTQPYRVDCLSITTAFAFGFDEGFCNTTGGACGATAPSAYFTTPSRRPFDELGIRPAMMLAGANTEEVEALIARGVASDDTTPSGSGWFVRTTDSARSVRWPNLQTLPALFPGEDTGVELTYVDNADGSGENTITGETDVLFYFTGLARVGGIGENTYLPGAVADHLTSFGGRVPTSGQMSVREWLAAGVTGSYGTVVEPCNYTAKFPNVERLLGWYLRGTTLLEAYWRSVAWPGEGLFVGEPLARPWGAQSFRYEGTTLTIETWAIAPSERWVLESADAEDGPWAEVLEVVGERWGQSTISLEDATAPFYRLRRD